MISFLGNNVNADYKELAYVFEFKNLNGGSLKLSEYKSKVIVVINVASQCGFTSQYEDMQKVWKTYQEKNIAILGVPSNDFGQQEPGSNKEIKNFCESKFGITFQLTEKVSAILPFLSIIILWKFHFGTADLPKFSLAQT